MGQFAFGVAGAGSIAAAFTALVLICQYRLSWGGLLPSVINAILICGVCGVVVGALLEDTGPIVFVPLSALLGRNAAKRVLTIVGVIVGVLAFGLGVWVAIMTAQHAGNFLWYWW